MDSEEIFHFHVSRSSRFTTSNCQSDDAQSGHCEFMETVVYRRTLYILLSGKNEYNVDKNILYESLSHSAAGRRKSNIDAIPRIRLHGYSFPRSPHERMIKNTWRFCIWERNTNLYVPSTRQTNSIYRHFRILIIFALGMVTYHWFIVAIFYFYYWHTRHTGYDIIQSL